MSSNQISNHKSKPGNMHQGQPSSSHRTDDEESELNFGSLGHVAEQASGYWERGQSQMREMVRDREGTTVLVALAAGMGVGLMIGSALAQSQRPQTWRDRIAAEGFGRRLMDRIESLIPDAVAEHFAR